MKTVAMAVAMNTAVATSERGEPRPMPQTPWPLVQPAPRRVPKPTIRPAMTRRGRGCIEFNGRQSTAEGDIDQGRDEHSGQKRQAPADLAALRRDQATEDAADARDPPVQHQKQGGGGADQKAADEGGHRE